MLPCHIIKGRTYVFIFYREHWRFDHAQITMNGLQCNISVDWAVEPLSFASRVFRISVHCWTRSFQYSLAWFIGSTIFKKSVLCTIRGDWTPIKWTNITSTVWCCGTKWRRKIILLLTFLSIVWQYFRVPEVPGKALNLENGLEGFEGVEFCHSDLEKFQFTVISFAPSYFCLQHAEYFVILNLQNLEFMGFFSSLKNFGDYSKLAKKTSNLTLF